MTCDKIIKHFILDILITHDMINTRSFILRISIKKYFKFLGSYFVVVRTLKWKAFKLKALMQILNLEY